MDENKEGKNVRNTNESFLKRDWTELEWWIVYAIVTGTLFLILGENHGIITGALP